MSPDMRRRPTGDSVNPGRSLGRRLTESFSVQGKKKDPKYKLYREGYGVYNGMTWEKLKGYLEQRFPQSDFPGLEFNEERVGDKWVFDVPEPLNDDRLADQVDKKELQRLRDSATVANTNLHAPATSRAEKRRSVSPEHKDDK
ncbi:hypothetical protein AYO20_07251 [Fonsecaea nubica]|uniref:Uncharacterized protein n=1 Tax=Fonsecaea nubica TaxID=856822 RepID=A0A178CXG9_9EURO|nr:hypothetical protein AYO20_07251 [Fonsecaea nubica]OAL33565.1 hypothetical protein AYO20_07251 [Fonsecaea nubica]